MDFKCNEIGLFNTKSFTSGNSQAGVSVLFIPPLFLSKCQDLLTS